jgi:hypothetical protein
MAVQNEGIKTYTASAALAAYRAVTLASNATAVGYPTAETSVVLGITQHAAANGADVDVKLIASGGSFKITAKAAVTMTTGGTLLYLYGTAAEGKFESSDQGSSVL